LTVPETFADRYLVASFPSGGVVVDLETGNYFRVDAKAAAACAALTRASTEEAASELAARFGVGYAHAQRIVADTRASLEAAPVVGAPTGPYHFYREEGGYGLWHKGERVLLVTDGELDIIVPEERRAERSSRLEFYVRALAPKILFIRGVSVLHASACAGNGKLVAFAGMSGAGKTTTVQAFVDEGARAISEDLVILKPGSQRPSVVLDGENHVHAWARNVSERLAEGKTVVSSKDLAGATDGAHEGLDVVHFLDATRRHPGSNFEPHTLGEPDGLLALMANDFLGDSSHDGWRRYFQLAEEMAADLDLIALDAPAGLSSLGPAARLYMSTWTS
jgi:hypothetical protein